MWARWFVRREPAGRHPPRRTALHLRLYMRSSCCGHCWYSCGGRCWRAAGRIRTPAWCRRRNSAGSPGQSGAVRFGSSAGHGVCCQSCHCVLRMSCSEIIRSHAVGANGSIWNLFASCARLTAAQFAHAQHPLHSCIVVACWQACEKKNAGHGRRRSEWTGSSEAHAQGACGNVARVRRRAA